MDSVFLIRFIDKNKEVVKIKTESIASDDLEEWGKICEENENYFLAHDEYNEISIHIISKREFPLIRTLSKS